MKILRRVGLNDLVVSKDVEVSNYVEIFDAEGNKIGEVETYHIGYENEDCDELDECHKCGELTPITEDLCKHCLTNQ